MKVLKQFLKGVAFLAGVILLFEAVHVVSFPTPTGSTFNPGTATSVRTSSSTFNPGTATSAGNSSNWPVWLGTTIVWLVAAIMGLSGLALLHWANAPKRRKD